VFLKQHKNGVIDFEVYDTLAQEYYYKTRGIAQRKGEEPCDRVMGPLADECAGSMSASQCLWTLVFVVAIQAGPASLLYQAYLPSMRLHADSTV